MGEETKNHGEGNLPERPSEEAYDASHEALDALLRRRGLPEPSPWFAARTVARLRNRRAERWGFRFSFPSLSFPMLPRRWAAGVAVLGLLMGLGFAGVRSQARQADQRLTFAALEMAAQGELPVSDEESPWPEGGYEGSY